jgi:hypothetical protein
VSSRKRKPDTSLWDDRTYRLKAKTLRERAYADPSATCWVCGKTLREGPRHKSGQPPTWHADHVIAGDPRSPLRVAHSTCNEGRGGAQRRGLWPPSPNR